MILLCQRCGASFSAESRHRRFCNRSCYLAANSDRPKLSDAEIAKRIDELISPEPNTGCWLWMGLVAPYPRLSISRHRTIFVHRFMLGLKPGDGRYACHRCDNPVCVNPDHLFAGSQRENMLDAARKQRMSHGETAPQSRLSEATAREAFAAVEAGDTICAVAKRFGVSPGTIRRLANGRGWKHLGLKFRQPLRCAICDRVLMSDRPSLRTCSKACFSEFGRRSSQRRWGKRVTGDLFEQVSR